MRRQLVSIVLALASFAFGPASADADPPSLTVFAAADLAFAFNEIAPRFEKATGARVTLVFGSTGNFAHQIRQGGPADVFFAADQSFIDSLIAERVLLRETRTLYAQGRIVLATARSVRGSPSCAVSWTRGFGTWRSRTPFTRRTAGRPSRR